MNRNSGNSRRRASAPRPSQNSRTARNVVRQALRREHGFTTTQTHTNIPTFRETKQINIGIRFRTTVNSASAVTAKLIADTIGATACDVKIRRVVLYVSPEDENKLNTLFVYSGRDLKEVQRIRVVGNRSLWVSGVIHPPQDDWIPITNTDNSVLVNAEYGSSQEYQIALEMTYRVIIPVGLTVAPPADSIPSTTASFLPAIVSPDQSSESD